eukprot:5490450-Prymnesium_polylepis.1
MRAVVAHLASPVGRSQSRHLVLRVRTFLRVRLRFPALQKFLKPEGILPRAGAKGGNESREIRARAQGRAAQGSCLIAPAPSKAAPGLWPEGTTWFNTAALGLPGRHTTTTC